MVRGPDVLSPQPESGMATIVSTIAPAARNSASLCFFMEVRTLLMMIWFILSSVHRYVPCHVPCKLPRDGLLNKNALYKITLRLGHRDPYLPTDYTDPAGLLG